MRSTRALVPFSLLSAFALAACTPEPDAAPAAAAPKAEAPALPADPLLAGTDASAVIRHDTPDPAGFDRKAFAGTFAGILPCADCPGIETSVEIRADGTFSQAEVRQGAKSTPTTGTMFSPKVYVNSCGPSAESVTVCRRTEPSSRIWTAAVASPPS